MTDALISPDAVVKIAGREYVFEGNFATFKALQHALKKDVVEIQGSIFQMTLGDFVTVLHTLVKCAGGVATEEAIGQWLVDDLGIDSPEHMYLRGEIIAFLAVALSPKRARDKKKAEITKALAELRQQHSLGQNIGNSA
jgi:hypothetical protein